MTSVEPVDTANWRRASGASGLLAAFNDASVIDSADVLVAQRLSALAKEDDERVMLAVALVVRGLRAGSVCLDLRSVEAQVAEADLPWPAIDGWLAARGEAYAHAFETPRVIRAAIDHTHVRPDAAISGAREIAFFPPMTGG